MGHCLHLRSASVENGEPKLPTTSVLSNGEIAINYADGYETISIKNNNSEIVRFSSDDYYTEKKLGSGFTGDNDDKTITSAINEINDAISEKMNISEMSTHSGSTLTGMTSSQFHLPTVTSSDNGKVLMVVDGEWTLVSLSTIYTGSGIPSSDTGEDGDIYLQTS